MTAIQRLAAKVLLFVLYYVCVVTNAGDADTTCPKPATLPRIAADRRLRNCLMASYNQDVIPVQNATGRVTILFHLKFIQIIDLNTKASMLRSKGWIEKSWVDPQLRWTPADYDGIDAIRIPAKSIWTPDIILYNNIDDEGMYAVDVLAVVHSNGTVTWTPHVLLKSFCSMSMRHFPHDHQVCQLVFGSWTYGNKQLNLKLTNQPNPKFLFQDKSWHISMLTANHYDAQKNGGSEFSNVLYTLAIARQSSFYSEMLLLPATMIAILTMTMFFIPPATGERLVFGVGLLLATVLLLQNVEEAVPGDTGDMPLIVMYLAFVQVMLTAGIILSLVVYNCQYRKTKKNSVPNYLKTVFLGRLSRLLCVPVESYVRVPQNLDDAECDMAFSTTDTDPPPTTTDASKDRAIESTLEEIRKYLRILAAQATTGSTGGGSHQQLVLNQWIQLAQVIDRLLFVVFLVITLLVTIIDV